LVATLDSGIVQERHHILTLVDMWREDRERTRSKTVSQILAFAGEGRLNDDSICSKEFRTLLSTLPNDVVKEYASQALHSNDKEFPDRGRALQDIVNDLGRRLGFDVEYGVYRGRHGESGHDGLWIDPNERHAIIIETKSSANYPIKLETITRYKSELQ
jgi:hypothetical protein